MMKKQIFVGSQSAANKPGISIFDFTNPEGAPSTQATATQAPTEQITGLENPTYFVLSEDGKDGKDGKFLFTVSETTEFKGEEGGSAASYKWDGANWKQVSQVAAKGKAPCHVCFGRKHLLTANYLSGSVSLFPVTEDGEIGELCDYHIHEGRGHDSVRQDHAYAHTVGWAGAEGELYVADLGLDKLIYYRLDPVRHKLLPNSAKDIALPPGSGPRQFVVDPIRPNLLYLLCELSSQILVIDLTRVDVPTREDDHIRVDEPIRQMLSMLPAGWNGVNTGDAENSSAVENTAAGVKLSPDGRFLYASNRGHDSVAVFEIVSDEAGNPRMLADEPEYLHLCQIFKVGAKRPWDIAVTENFVISANQGSDSVSFISRDPVNGKLSQVLEHITVEKPTCVVMR